MPYDILPLSHPNRQDLTVLIRGNCLPHPNGCLLWTGPLARWENEEPVPVVRVPGHLLDKRYRSFFDVRRFLKENTDRTTKEPMKTVSTCHTLRCVNPAHTIWVPRSTGPRPEPVQTTVQAPVVSDHQETRVLQRTGRHTKLSPGQAQNILDLAHSGMTSGAVGDLFDVSPEQVRKIWKREAWPELVPSWEEVGETGGLVYRTPDGQVRRGKRHHPLTDEWDEKEQKRWALYDRARAMGQRAAQQKRKIPQGSQGGPGG